MLTCTVMRVWIIFLSGCTCFVEERSWFSWTSLYSFIVANLVPSVCGRKSLTASSLSFSPHVFVIIQSQSCTLSVCLFRFILRDVDSSWLFSFFCHHMVIVFFSSTIYVYDHISMVAAANIVKSQGVNSKHGIFHLLIVTKASSLITRYVIINHL